MNRFLILTSLFFFVLSHSTTAEAQQYKLRQSTGMMGMNSESTVYVKGKRKRTESSAMMPGMPVPPVIIEQCDLQRFVKLNDKKKLYYIEPFANEGEVIDEDMKTPVKTKPVPVKTTTKKGGTIHMWYIITDTGERKKMNGFTARHIWTTQKMKPSEDACTMKDSLIIKTDGWYIDLPEFNCQVRYAAQKPNLPSDPKKPECIDNFVTHRSGKGKLGFPLTETRTIIMGGQKTTDFTTNLETVEFVSMKLDSILFEIPPGYTQVTEEAELQDKVDYQDMMKQYKSEAGNNNFKNNIPLSTEKAPGAVRIGVFEPQNDGQLQAAPLQQYFAGILNSGNIEAVVVSSEEEARSKNCDYTLATNFTKIKSGSKVGGLLKAIKNTDPGASASFNMEAILNLKRLSDNSSLSPQTISGKYDGKVDEAAKRALDDGSRLVLKSLK